MHIKSLYISNKKESVQEFDENIPKPTPEADLESDSKNIISNPDENVKNSFAVDEPVEQVRNLVAVHNINEEKLIKSLRLGGLPMPSIAVIKAKEAKEIRTAFLSVLENASENYKSGQKDNTVNNGVGDNTKIKNSFNTSSNGLANDLLNNYDEELKKLLWKKAE